MTKFKQLFSTPKKAAVTILCILAMVAVLGTGTVFAASAIAESSSIGAENAKNFAFADAGVDPVSASNVKAEFDYEHGQFVYEVEFMAGNSEYEYWIKASNGTVVKKQVEIVTQDGSSAIATAEITLDRAKEIALEDAGLAAADVTFTKEKLDVDDGISVYDVDFYADNVEYEYEINAVTGAVYSKSREALMTTASSNPEGTSSATASEPQTNQANTADDRIGVETAKEKALADAVREGRLLGAGIDCVEEEPLSPDDPLLNTPGIIVTPHIGGGTADIADRIIPMLVEDIEDYAQGKTPRHLVNGAFLN